MDATHAIVKRVWEEEYRLVRYSLTSSSEAGLQLRPSPSFHLFEVVAAVLSLDYSSVSCPYERLTRILISSSHMSIPFCCSPPATFSPHTSCSQRMQLSFFMIVLSVAVTGSTDGKIHRQSMVQHSC